MALKVDNKGDLKKERKAPKYYEHRIGWVEITPELELKYRSKPLTYPEHIAIAKTINYTGEMVRRAMLPETKRVNRVIWEAIVKYIDAHKSPTGPVSAKPAAKKTKKAAKTAKTAKSTDLATKKQPTEAVSRFLSNRRSKK